VIVPEFDDPAVPFQGCLDDAALDPPTASVDDAHLVKAGGGSCIDVFLNDRGHIARGERVKIELVLDGKSQRLFGHGDGSAICGRGFRVCESIAVVQAFRPAVSGGPKGPHYFRSD
jgi:hypothetical protein